MAVKCKELIYTPINALSFRIGGGTHLLTPNKENKIIKFAETFKLVYILKDRSDVRRELDMELNPLISYEIKKQDDLWE